MATLCLQPGLLSGRQGHAAVLLLREASTGGSESARCLSATSRVEWRDLPAPLPLALRRAWVSLSASALLVAAGTLVCLRLLLWASFLSGGWGSGDSRDSGPWGGLWADFLQGQD